jgi:hypothetical protein
VRLSGPLDVATLERCFNEVIRRHESLRTTFSTVDDQPVQVIAPTLDLSMPMMDLGGLSKGEQATLVQRLATEEAQRPFDLLHGPLVRATVLLLREQEQILLLTMYHVISDGWSMGRSCYRNGTRAWLSFQSSGVSTSYLNPRWSEARRQWQSCSRPGA